MAGKRKTKKKSLHEQLKGSFRRIWNINPVEKVVPSKKVYKRKLKHKNKEDE